MPKSIHSKPAVKQRRASLSRPSDKRSESARSCGTSIVKFFSSPAFPAFATVRTPVKLTPRPLHAIPALPAPFKVSACVLQA